MIIVYYTLGNTTHIDYKLRLIIFFGNLQKYKLMLYYSPQGALYRTNKDFLSAK